MSGKGKNWRIYMIDSIDCCAWRLLSQQPDFLEQKSSVQEVIEAAGHLCIFLPKGVAQRFDEPSTN